MLAPINSVKHYVHRSNTSVASGAVLNTTVADSVVAPATSTAADVKQGSILKAVFIEFWLWGGGLTGVDTQFNLAFYKAPVGVVAITAAQLNNLGSYPNKKNVFYHTQGVIGAGVDGSPAVPVLRQWMLIPKGKQRFGLDDRLFISVTSTGTALQVCGFITYKEYT